MLRYLLLLTLGSGAVSCTPYTKPDSPVLNTVQEMTVNTGPSQPVWALSNGKMLSNDWQNWSRFPAKRNAVSYSNGP
jgi:hypothetical protein